MKPTKRILEAMDIIGLSILARQHQGTTLGQAYQKAYERAKQKWLDYYKNHCPTCGRRKPI